jgi:hypothetical protein
MDSAFERSVEDMHTQPKKEEVPNEWAYIGRFMWGFGQVESLVNELFRQLFGLNGLLYFLLLGNLDLRKKVELMKVGFKHQGATKGDVVHNLGRVHKLHNIRNAVAHGSFYYEPVHDGIIFGDYVKARE